MTTLARKPDFTSDDLIEGSALHTITKAREDAYNRGIAEGLRRSIAILTILQSEVTQLERQADAVEQEANNDTNK